MKQLLMTPLDYLTPSNIAIDLTFHPIKMMHDNNWRVSKKLHSYDLVIGLGGEACYEINKQIYHMKEGHFLLLEPNDHFIAYTTGEHFYYGIAQHFRAHLLKNIDFFKTISFRKHVKLTNWNNIKPLVEFYRNISTNNRNHVQILGLFQCILFEFIKESFLDLKSDSELPYYVLYFANEIENIAHTNQNIEELQSKIAYSWDYFSRQFQKYTGKTPKQYLMDAKMRQAEQMLLYARSVQEVAFQLGYEDPLYFSKCFKKFKGSAPSQFIIK